MMKRYGNLSGNAGVRGFESGARHIDVWFVGESEPYRYTSRRVGEENVARMKQLAEAGRGLTTYISTHPEVRENYVRPGG